MPHGVSPSMGFTGLFPYRPPSNGDPGVLTPPSPCHCEAPILFTSQV